VDILRFFDATIRPSHLRYDLAIDQEASDDLRTFARSQFDLIALEWHLPPTWPEESDFNRVISREKGLFIFIRTLVLSLERCEDPKESLKETLQDAGLESLYGLYSSIIKARIVKSNAEFQRMIGVLLTTAPYRLLCEETIAELAGVKPYLVKGWVDTLSSLLYRDGGTNGVVRIHHFVNLRFLPQR
jgi:hypothetical protein